MEKRRVPPRALLQHVFALTKLSTDQQVSTNLSIPVWHSISQRETSVNSDVPVLNSPLLQPTYALGPQKRFDFARAQKLLQLELNRRCGRIPKSIRYEPKLVLDFVRDLAPQLRRIIKPDYLNSPRYKVIVMVSITQTTPNRHIHQGMITASRCLWDRDTDGSVTVKTDLGRDMVVIATAFAVYTE